MVLSGRCFKIIFLFWNFDKNYRCALRAKLIKRNNTKPHNWYINTPYVHRWDDMPIEIWFISSVEVEVAQIGHTYGVGDGLKILK